MSRAAGIVALILTPFLAAWIGCAPAPPAAAPTLNLTPAGATAAEPVVSNHYMGRVSCAAAGCHGFNSSTTTSWSNAYQLWDSTDPHRWAFDVLYTERSYKIYEQLEQPANDTVDKATYLKFLVDRCVGCHATAPEGTRLTPTGTPVRFAADEPEDFSQGVSCESCHGPAGGWEGRHFLLSWKHKADSAQRAGYKAKYGFQDLRPLTNRAEVCMKCHVGPQVVGDGSDRKVYDVNHDLIAAGHPRLNFEFNAYLSNLPKHWDEAADKARHGPDSFHFKVWRVGQVQKIAQLTTLKSERPKDEWAEFANHDCRKCHHAIGEPNFVWNKREPWSLKQLTAAKAPASLLQDLIKQSEKPIAMQPAPGFDEAVDLYLAAKAWSQDRPASPELTAAVEALAAEIEKQHEQQGGKNQYDLIDGFNPTKEFGDALRRLKDELEKLSQK